MGKSRANLVLGAAGRQAAEQMEERIGTPCLFLPATHLPEEIEENYRKLGAFLGCWREPDFDLAAAADRPRKPYRRPGQQWERSRL